MVISKSLAYDIALKLSEKRRNECEELHELLKQLVYKVYQKMIPKIINDAYLIAPDFFRERSAIYLCGHGFDEKRISCPEDWLAIVNNNEDNKCYLHMKNLPEATRKEIQAAHRAYVKADDAVNALRKELASALLSLKTYKKISEEIPEAIPMLPKKFPVPAVVVNVSALRKKFL